MRIREEREKGKGYHVKEMKLRNSTLLIWLEFDVIILLSSDSQPVSATE